MIFDHILCHYSEIGLKGKNRGYFEDSLRQNILKTLSLYCADSPKSVRRYHGRLVVKLDEKTTDPSLLINALRDVMGIAYCAPAFESKQKIERLKTDAYDLLSEMDFKTFRVTARRGGSSVPFTSMEVNEKVGDHIVKTLKKKVKLRSPEINCYVDLFEQRAFIYYERISGPGGLPVGVSGKVAVMMSGGIDSPVAAYLAMKRGARVIFVHFHSVPYTTPASIEKVREIITTLNKFHFQSRVYLVELAPIQKHIMEKTTVRFRVLLYRRFMLRITEAIAIKEKATSIVTGESLGQVASQTLDNIDAVGRVSKMSILRPVIGFDKQEIIDMAKSIGTYDISIQPDQDCCSLFVPKRPATRARAEQLKMQEIKLKVNFLVESALESAKIEIIG